jgi:hypothetical protein
MNIRSKTQIQFILHNITMKLPPLIPSPTIIATKRQQTRNCKPIGFHPIILYIFYHLPQFLIKTATPGGRIARYYYIQEH